MIRPFLDSIPTLNLREVRTVLRASLVTVAALVLSGCVTVGQIENIQRDINEIKTDLSRVKEAQGDGFTEISMSQKQSAEEIQTLSRQIKALREDLDFYLSNRGSGGAASSSSGSDYVQPGAGTPETSSEESDLMLRAEEEFAQANYQQAAAIYEQLLRDYPASPRASEAGFRLGQCYYQNQDFARARQAFDQVRIRYPASGDIIPLSLHSRGLCEYQLGDMASARATFEDLRARFPSYEPEKIQKLLDELPGQ